jgi:hypothetical protein
VVSEKVIDFLKEIFFWTLFVAGFFNCKFIASNNQNTPIGVIQLVDFCSYKTPETYIGKGIRACKDD